MLGRLRSGIAFCPILTSVACSRIQQAPPLSKRSTSKLIEDPSSSSLSSSSTSSSLPPPLGLSRTSPAARSSHSSPSSSSSVKQDPSVFVHPSRPQLFNLLHDLDAARATRIKLMHGKEYAVSAVLRRQASRLGTLDREIMYRAKMVSDIASVVRQHGLDIALLGPVSTSTHVEKSILILGIVSSDGSSVPESRLANLVEPLRSAGLKVNSLSTSVRCETIPSKEFPLATIAFLSLPTKEALLLNALIFSYTSLSKNILVPLIRAITATGPGKEFILNTTTRNNTIAFLCIAFLQSLHPPLLPNLQSPDLIAQLQPPPSTTPLPVLWRHVGLEDVNSTFVPIGLTRGLLESMGWKDRKRDERVLLLEEWRKRALQSPPLNDLVREFYLLYGGKSPEVFDWRTGVVSVKHGGLRKREEVFGQEKWGGGVRNLTVQHPFVDTMNYAASNKMSPTEIESSFLRCLDDELLQPESLPLEDLITGHHLSPPSQRASIPVVFQPTPKPSLRSTTSSSSKPSKRNGYRVDFHNLPSSFNIPTFMRFLTGAEVMDHLKSDIKLYPSPDGTSLEGRIILKTKVGVDMARRLDGMTVYGQPISVQFVPGKSTAPKL